MPRAFFAVARAERAADLAAIQGRLYKCGHHSAKCTDIIKIPAHKVTDQRAAISDALGDARGDLIAQRGPICAGKRGFSQVRRLGRSGTEQWIAGIHALGDAGADSVTNIHRRIHRTAPWSQRSIHPSGGRICYAAETGTKAVRQGIAPTGARRLELGRAHPRNRHRAGHHGVHGAQHPGLLLPEGGGQIPRPLRGEIQRRK